MSSVAVYDMVKHVSELECQANHLSNNLDSYLRLYSVARHHEYGELVSDTLQGVKIVVDKVEAGLKYVPNINRPPRNVIVKPKLALRMSMMTVYAKTPLDVLTFNTAIAAIREVLGEIQTLMNGAPKALQSGYDDLLLSSLRKQLAFVIGTLRDEAQALKQKVEVHSR
ncbi:hypothetical protein HGRIS_001464 [Hohenbuehelia grisea]|uniref:Uncharacterized protein n=1 Tax=Hohenbuehelia grisea TaxID=104357 RepID=A0ABR3JQX3_9AGAR